MRRLSFILPIVLCLSFQANAAEILSVERENHEAELRGLVDFDSVSAAPLPGIRYRARIPFRGLIASTYFYGQIPIAGLNGSQTYAINYGRPESPLEPVADGRGFSTLMALHLPENEKDVLLTSRVYESGLPRRDSAIGYGAIALKFSDRQPVIGFDLEPVTRNNRLKPNVQIKLFSVDGELLGNPIILSDFGRYTLL